MHFSSYSTLNSFEAIEFLHKDL